MMTVGKLKQLVRKYSTEKGVPHQILYQNFMFERFLERLSVSDYKDRFVLKGGFLIASLTGIETRTTDDIDVTLQNLSMDEDTIRDTINKILEIQIDDRVEFSIHSLKEIRDEDEYKGFRLKILGRFKTMNIYFKIDLSTGDVITPNPSYLDIPLLIENKSIKLLSYNFETILAEKVETILSRSVGNTRSKDFYDVYIISSLYNTKLDYDVLTKALVNTMEHRRTMELISNIDSITKEINNSDELSQYWRNYISKHEFAQGVSFKRCLKQLEEILGKTIKKK